MQGYLLLFLLELKNEFNFIEKLASSSLIPEYITIDIAHGHSNSVINMIKHIKTFTK